MQRRSGASLECRGVYAYRERRLGEVIVYSSTQTPHTMLASGGRTVRNAMRVVAPDVGGGFGPKARLYPEEIILAALALELDHPVRWIEDRSEHLTDAAYPRPSLQGDRLCRRAGPHPRRRSEVIVDAGAYGVAEGRSMEANMAARTLPGPYDIPDYRARAITVATNKAPLGPYRGVGRAGACFAIERTVDEIARAVGRDPDEVRIDNMIPPEQMPYTSVAGMRYDTGDYPASVRRAPSCWTCRRSARGSSGASRTAG